MSERMLKLTSPAFPGWRKELMKREWQIYEVSCSYITTVWLEYISMEKNKMVQKDAAVLFVHGKGGNAGEAEHFEALFVDWN